MLLGDGIDSHGKKLESILTIDDGKRIWRHFQRFAEYNDLKELYQKCIPPLVGFDQKIIDLADQIEKFNHIILKFDSVLTNKVERSQFNQFKVDAIDQFLGYEYRNDIDKRLKSF